MRIFFFFFVLFDNSPLPARYQHKLITRQQSWTRYQISLICMGCRSGCARLDVFCFCRTGAIRADIVSVCT